MICYLYFQFLTGTKSNFTKIKARALFFLEDVLLHEYWDEIWLFVYDIVFNNCLFLDFKLFLYLVH